MEDVGGKVLEEHSTFIHIARREHQIEEFTAIIDDQMQFESKKPTGSLSALGQPGKNLGKVDSRVLTHRQDHGIRITLL